MKSRFQRQQQRETAEARTAERGQWLKERGITATSNPAELSDEAIQVAVKYYLALNLREERELDADPEGCFGGRGNNQGEIIVARSEALYFRFQSEVDRRRDERRAQGLCPRCGGSGTLVKVHSMGRTMECCGERFIVRC